MTRQNEYTVATLAVEGLVPSEAARRLCDLVAAGEMDADTAIVSILDAYGLRMSENA